MSRTSKAQIREAYGVSETDLNNIIDDTIQEIGNVTPGDTEGQKDRVNAAYTTSNSKAWTLLRDELISWLRSSSSWAYRFNNNSISEETHAITSGFIVKQARDILRAGKWEAFNFPPPPPKIEPLESSMRRAYSTSPRSTAASVTEGLERMTMPTHPKVLVSLRDFSVDVECVDGPSISNRARIPFANLASLELLTRRDQPIRRHDIKLDVLDKRLASKFSLPAQSREYWYAPTGDSIRNEHEWQAALADFMRGIRDDDTADMRLQSTPRPGGDLMRQWRGEDTSTNTTLGRERAVHPDHTLSSQRTFELPPNAPTTKPLLCSSDLGLGITSNNAKAVHLGATPPELRANSAPPDLIPSPRSDDTDGLVVISKGPRKRPEWAPAPPPRQKGVSFTISGGLAPPEKGPDGQEQSANQLQEHTQSPSAPKVVADLDATTKSSNEGTDSHAGVTRPRNPAAPAEIPDKPSSDSPSEPSDDPESDSPGVDHRQRRIRRSARTVPDDSDSDPDYEPQGPTADGTTAQTHKGETGATGPGAEESMADALSLFKARMEEDGLEDPAQVVEEEEDDGNEKLDTADEIQAVMKDRLVEMFSDGTAFSEAQLIDAKLWERAAKFFGVSLDALMHSKDDHVDLPPNFGWRKGFRPTVLQIVGAFAMFERLYGDRLGAILADEMGLGKTIETLMVVLSAYSYAIQTYSKHPCSNPLPAIEDGLMGGYKPKIGVTWIQASAPGLVAWPKAWKIMLENSTLVRDCLDKGWAVKMVILHEKGKEWATLYGGEKCGLFYDLSDAEKTLIKGRPNWDKARPIYDPVKTPGWIPWDANPTEDIEWLEDAPYPHKEDYEPRTTSYIIVTTRQSVPTRWFDTRIGHKEFPGYLHQLTKPEKGKSKPTNKSREDATNSLRSFLKGSSKNVDGKHITQTTRAGKYKGRKVTWVADCYRGAVVVIDELHDTQKESTITYRSIVAPFKANPIADQPSFLGITGSPFEDGIKVVCSFAFHALKRDHWGQSDNNTLKAIHSLQSNFASIWTKLLARLTKDRVTASQIRDVLDSDKEIQQTVDALAKLVKDFFVWRNMETRDPWGRPLVKNVPPLETAMVRVRYNMEDVAKMKEKERDLRIRMNAARAQRIADAGGKVVGGAMTKDFLNEYQISRVEATFPNLIPTLREWDRDHPDEPQFFPGGEVDSLGSSNTKLAEILKPRNLDDPDCLLWGLIPRLVAGSKKMDWILEQAEKINATKEEMANPIKPGQVLRYKKKWIVGSGLRVVAAVMYCVLKTKYPEALRVSSGAERDKNTKLWRQIYTDTGTLNDKNWLIVFNLGVVCQSVDLIEGSICTVMEPCPNNGYVVQMGKRQCRIGNKAPKCRVEWLYNEDSGVELQIIANLHKKNAFKAQLMKTRVTEADDNEEEEQDVEATLV